MIRMGVDDSGVQKFIGAIDGMAATVKTTQFTGPLLKHIHNVMADHFDEAADVIAATSKSNFHHVYEWGMTGIGRGRLWKHTLSGSGNNRMAGFQWKASKVPIPSPKERSQNANDPISRLSDEDLAKLSSRRYFFYWKAPVMEYNQTVHIVGRNSPKKMLMIPTWTDQKVGKEDKPFVFARSATMPVPGGEATTGRFSGLWMTWWASEANSVFDREIRTALEKDLAESVTSTIRRRSKSISINANTRGEFERGRIEAQQFLAKKARQYNRDSEDDFEL